MRIAFRAWVDRYASVRQAETLVALELRKAVPVTFRRPKRGDEGLAEPGKPYRTSRREHRLEPLGPPQ